MYYRVHGIYFPPLSRGTGTMMEPFPLTNTLLDGELVVDTLAKGQTKLRLLLFDCLVIDSMNITNRPLSRRYASLQMQLFPAFRKFMQGHPDLQMMLPFEIQVKPMDLAYGIRAVIEHKIPHLLHGNDGLIFTSFESPYVFGTNSKILKWKPPHENTIDFMLRLRFPPDFEADKSGNTPDYCAKPLFQLWQHESGDVHVPFDWLDMDDDEWERWKESGQQLDERIAECAWHPPASGDESISTWHIKRLRDDKITANHKTTISRILQSVRDGVSEEELISLVPAIREAWKTPERESHRAELFGPSRQVRRKSCFKGLGGPGAPLVRGGMPNIKR